MAFALLRLTPSGEEPTMALKRLYDSVSCARAAFYSAFSSPNMGMTWAVVTFLTGVLYLIYNQLKPQIVEAELESEPAGPESSGEEQQIEAHLT
jgi:hypothetical protein